MIVRELLARVGIQIDQQSISAADRAIGKVKTALLGLAGAYGVKQIYDTIQAKFENIANTAVELTTLAQKTGMTTEALQELQYAAAQTNVDTGELRMGLVHLQRAAFEASTQGGQTGAAFKRLGIEVTDASGKLLPTNQLLGMVADKFQAMPDGAQKTALSMALLSRSGAQMIPLLDKGSAGLAKMGIEARRTGGLMSDGMIKQGVALHQGMLRLQYAIQGVTYAILGPFVQSVTAGKNSLASWLAMHRQIISLRIQEAVSVIAGAFHLAAKGAKALGDWLLPIGAILLGLLSPITLVIAALAYLAYDLNRYFEGKDSFFTRLAYAFEKWGDSVKGNNPFVAFFTDALAAAKIFFEFVDGKMNALVGYHGQQQTTMADQPWQKQAYKWLEYNFARLIGIDAKPEDHFLGRDAFYGAPGAQFAYPMIDGQRYQVDGKTGAGHGDGPWAPGRTITFGDIIIHAPSSDARDINAAVRQGISDALSEADPGRD